MKGKMPRLVKVGAILLFAAGVAALTLTVGLAQPPAPRKVFTDSVIPLPAQTGPTAHGLMVTATAPENKEEKLNVVFSLALSAEDQAKLEALVAKGEVVPPKELAEKYTPKEADVTALKNWLTGQGYEITYTSPDKTSIYARSTVSQIEKTLQVQMVRVSRDGFTYTAARNAPSLPADVGTGVQAIIGLQPFRHAHKQSRLRTPHSGNRATPSAHVNIPNPTPAIANAPPYLVKEVLKAYNADGLSLTGAGQKIAILIDTFPQDTDLTAFWTQNGLPVKLNQVEKINVKNEPLDSPSGEETLDVQWTSGIAPGATIRVYASGTLAFVDLDKALDRILGDLQNEPGLRQLSISLGLGETFLGGPSGEAKIEHQKFTKLAAAGVNVFVSSGDSGSNPDDTGHAHGPTAMVEYQSSDPMVIGVGGTSLNLKTTGDVASEKAWEESGGGESIFFDRPSYQIRDGMPAGNKRLVPDVSCVADPDTGALIVLQGQVQQIGGTSLSAPVFAGFCALTNEARRKANKPLLPFLNPLLYPLQGTAAFRDITEGSNGAFSAGPGYDRVTGIGVPNMKELVNALTK
jgi:kumamolisin